MVIRGYEPSHGITRPQPLLNLYLPVSEQSKMVGGDREVLQQTSRHIDSHRQSQPTQYCQLCLSILNFTTDRLQDTASKWLHPECEDEETQTRPGSLPTKWQLSRSTHWDAGFGPWIWKILFPCHGRFCSLIKWRRALPPSFFILPSYRKRTTSNWPVNGWHPRHYNNQRKDHL